MRKYNGKKDNKLLVRLPKRINKIKLKISLDIPDLCLYLISKLLKLKIKYENLFNEKLNIYNNII